MGAGRGTWRAPEGPSRSILLRAGQPPTDLTGVECPQALTANPETRFSALGFKLLVLCSEASPGAEFHVAAPLAPLCPPAGGKASMYPFPHLQAPCQHINQGLMVFQTDPLSSLLGPQSVIARFSTPVPGKVNWVGVKAQW